ncbi:minor capsid protein [Streptococcus dysgalactiae]|uniref:minor capsid protein n=1 Tax=Streptococcus dysgalactiae TaxID=1334 RepID=UPI0012A9ECE8|nr:minor capsid protein [Streptococcus dysgalactiae]QGH03214.1 phage head morphogenesis protein [Streptococcus dysgalactiae subsp. dysgalactiae]
MAKTPQQYWNERQKQLWANLETSERALQVKLSKYYADEVKALEKEIGAYFSKYGKDNVIEYRNLLQQLSKADKDLLYRDCERFAKKYPQHADLIPVRTSIYKLDRLQGLELSIKMQQLEIGAIEEAELTKHLTTVFKKGYQETAKTIGFQTDKVSAELFVNNDWTGKGNFSSSIWTNKDKLVNYLTNDFKTAIIRGDSFDKVVKQMSERFTVRSQSDITRLIMTEGTYINNQAMMKPFEDSGLYDEFEFVAVLDGHTSSLCKNLDGQKFPMKSKQVGVNFPPMHANCRSTFAMVIPDDYLER